MPPPSAEKLARVEANVRKLAEPRPANESPRDVLARINRTARAATRGTRARDWERKRADRKPGDLTPEAVEEARSPNEVALGVGPSFPEAQPFDSAQAPPKSFKARSPLAPDDGELRIFPVSEVATGDSLVERTFHMSANPMADDPHRFAEPLRDRMTYPSAAKAVHEAREAKGWTVEKLAAQVGLATRTIEDIERGGRPSDDEAAAVRSG